MAICKLCGENSESLTTQVLFRTDKHLTLCDYCDKQIPKKPSRRVFDLIYWDSQKGPVAESTKKEFWEDFRLSHHSSVVEYLKYTTNFVDDAQILLEIAVREGFVRAILQEEVAVCADQQLKTLMHVGYGIGKKCYDAIQKIGGVHKLLTEYISFRIEEMLNTILSC